MGKAEARLICAIVMEPSSRLAPESQKKCMCHKEAASCLPLAGPAKPYADLLPPIPLLHALQLPCATAWLLGRTDKVTPASWVAGPKKAQGFRINVQVWLLNKHKSGRGIQNMLWPDPALSLFHCPEPLLAGASGWVLPSRSQPEVQPTWVPSAEAVHTALPLLHSE